MKKKLLAITLIITGTLASCASGGLSSSNTEIISGDSTSIEKSVEFSMIVPSGTPLLAISKYLYENKNANYEVCNGSDPLVASFTSKSHDVIVAPINLGANYYNKTGNYLLFETIVWGNLYVVSRKSINSFLDLNEKEITIFGTNQTPDIIMQTLASENNITYTKDTVSDVNMANEKFMSGLCDYAVSAEPNLSKLKTQIDELYVLDLQEEWKKITGSASYPQAAVFVNKDKVNELELELTKIKDSVNTILDDLDYSSNCALETPLKSLGKETILSALPASHIRTEVNQKDAIEFYFNKLSALGLEKTYGEVLPDENFYL